MTYTSRPTLSVVVIAYNIPRELPRTLHSLCADYQRHIAASDYEVIVVDNGSDVPVDAAWVAGLPGNFRVLRIDDAAPSPAQAINRAIAQAQGEIIGVMIDGARIASPGLLHFASHGAKLYEKAAVATLGWYLGFDFQGRTQDHDAERAREDALLKSIQWPQDGYRLFEIATMDESSVDGWLQPISESNALFLRRELWNTLGGVCEQFETPGGGLLNLDTFSRAIEQPGVELIIPLGEATFHQRHGGTNTNSSSPQQLENINRWAQEYEAVRGCRYLTPPQKQPTYIGTLPRPALARFARAALQPATRHVEPPLGRDFHPVLWTDELQSSDDPVIARLIDLARTEFVNSRFEASCAIARLIYARAPDEPATRRLLSLVAPSVSIAGPHEQRRTEYHLGLAEAHRVLGENDLATTHYYAALALDANLPQAHLGLSALRMPGDGYLNLLEKLYGALCPETAVEIGVFEGASLALFRPPTIAIGVDPSAKLLAPLHTETHLFAETSDEFFAKRRYHLLVGDRPLSVGFIDGLHIFEQALKDFIGLEALCGPRSLILLHDTIPLDDATQSRERNTVFHTGDVWKVLLCLRHYRPDLEMITVATPPTGLTFVTRPDPSSRVLADRYDEAVTRFVDTPFSTIASVAGSALNIVPNDWDYVRGYLSERQVFRQRTAEPESS